ncbi:hypothetical protein ANCCAN_26427 [Ancylostoma caninum]|uniref:Uncharacterized protein n=1 Tax=Ancylostoma caninum TaxID=29170 RepID=A0A368F6W2_ANCCA|nr:hypothetical protein ANCCAN_26427 [Ancylostoma caninum]
MSTSGGDILQEEEEKGTILLVQEAPDEWHRTYAGLLYVMTCITSLAIHTIFVAGIRKLCGWKSNFSFTLLLILSLMCMMRFLCDLVGSMAAVLRVEWENYDILWIVLCMATCELVFFLYWQFANVEDYDMWAAVIAEISNLLHYDALILPYLLMNKQIHSQLKSIWRKNVVHVVPLPLMKGNVRTHLR